MKRGTNHVYRILNLPHDAHTWLLGPLLKQNHIKKQFIVRIVRFLFGMLKCPNGVAFWGYHIHLLYNNLLSPNYSYCILHNHLHCSTPVISFCYLIITQLYNYCINTVASDAFVISGS